MKPKDKANSETADLKRRAEDRLAESAKPATSPSRGDLARLKHELEVYQIELEIQNEELRQAKLELELRESRERVVRLRAPSGIGVWEWERGARNIYWSPECFDIFGVELCCPTVDTLMQLLQPEDAARVERAVGDVLNDGKARSIQFKIVRPNGEVTWVSASGEANKYDKDRMPLRLVGTVQDITKRMRADDDASPGPSTKPKR
jgi:PAS domain S-box-containing protein